MEGKEVVETSGVGHTCAWAGIINVFQSELMSIMSITWSERCARCMCCVCTYKPAPLVILLATVVTHSELVLSGEVSYMYMHVQCILLVVT